MQLTYTLRIQIKIKIKLMLLYVKVRTSNGVIVLPIKLDQIFFCDCIVCTLYTVHCTARIT